MGTDKANMQNIILREMKGLKTDVGALKTRMDRVEQNFNDVKVDIDSIHEQLAFIKDHAVMREELEEKLDGLKNDIFTKIDDFVQLHSKLDEEQIALRALYFRHERNINKMGTHLQLELE